MHELALAQGMLDIALEELARHNCTRLKLLRVEVGALSGVVCESLSFAFESLVKGTVHEKAVLEDYRDQAERKGRESRAHSLSDAAAREEKRVMTETLAARREKWVCPPPNVTRGYLARYAKLVSSANKGAIVE